MGMNNLKNETCALLASSTTNFHDRMDDTSPCYSTVHITSLFSSDTLSHTFSTLINWKQSGFLKYYLLAITGPDFMQPMYTRGFDLCCAKIDPVMPV